MPPTLTTTQTRPVKLRRDPTNQRVFITQPQWPDLIEWLTESARTNKAKGWAQPFWGTIGHAYETHGGVIPPQLFWQNPHPTKTPPHPPDTHITYRALQPHTSTTTRKRVFITQPEWPGTIDWLKAEGQHHKVNGWATIAWSIIADAYEAHGGQIPADAYADTGG